MLKVTQFCNFFQFWALGKITFSKIAAQAFEAGDFLKLFLGFWGFWGSISYKNISDKKMCM